MRAETLEYETIWISASFAISISSFSKVLLQYFLLIDASIYYRLSCVQWLKCLVDFYFFLKMIDD